MAAGIIVHGGAGKVAEDSISLRLDGCRAAAQAGYSVLQAGGHAADAVVAAVMVLEDNPLFNAGTGSTLNSRGQVETDAAIMDGATLEAGAIAAVSRIKNPIKLAYEVMQDKRHVLLAGEGASGFAELRGIPLCDPAALIVDVQRTRWEKSHGTVGAVAIDQSGGYAAGTSTGGIFNKLPGRVGDTPLIGCGTYANREVAVSCTGDGEDIIRTTLARHAAYLAAAGRHAREVAHATIRYFEQYMRGEAGIILMDAQGNPGYAKNSRHMPVCVVSEQGEVEDV